MPILNYSPALAISELQAQLARRGVAAIAMRSRGLGLESGAEATTSAGCSSAAVRFYNPAAGSVGAGEDGTVTP